MAGPESPRKRNRSLWESTKSWGVTGIPAACGTGILAEPSWISGARRPLLTSAPIIKQKAPTATLSCLSCQQVRAAWQELMKCLLKRLACQWSLDRWLLILCSSAIPVPSETTCGSRFSRTQSPGRGLRPQVQWHTGEEVCNVRRSLRSRAWSEWSLSPWKPPPLGSRKEHRKSQTGVQILP